MQKWILLFCLIGCITLLSPLDAQAKGKESVMKRLQEETAVRKQKRLRSDRVGLGLILGSTTNDRFARSSLVGGRLEYYLKDSLGIGVHASLGIVSETNLATQIKATRPSLGQPQFFQGIGLDLGGDLIFVPAFGKLSILGIINARYDFQFTLGASFIKMQSIENGDSYDRFALAPAVGSGFRLFFSDQFALNFQLKDYIYSRIENLIPINNNGVEEVNENASWQNHFIFNMSFSFFLGKPQVGR
jgi:outer membrane beta-barrel protein